MKIKLIPIFVLMMAGVVQAQLSHQEAERRLQERQAARMAAATQPASQSMVDQLTKQIASMEREIASLKAENEKLRNGIVFDDTAKPVAKSNPRGRLSGISGAGGAIDKIPSRLMSKKSEDETSLDVQLRDKWIADNYAGCSISISKVKLDNVTADADGFSLTGEGYEIGPPPSRFSVQGEVPSQFRARVTELNDGDELSIIGTIKHIEMHRSEIKLPKVEKEWPGMEVRLQLTDVRIISVIRKPKREE